MTYWMLQKSNSMRTENCKRHPVSNITLRDHLLRCSRSHCHRSITGSRPLGNYSPQQSRHFVCRVYQLVRALFRQVEHRYIESAFPFCRYHHKINQAGLLSLTSLLIRFSWVTSHALHGSHGKFI